MKGVLLWLLFIMTTNNTTIVGGMDLRALPPTHDLAHHHHFYYKTPLPEAFMPLCGNGIVNSQADYEHYYNNNNNHVRSRLMVNRSQLTVGGVGTTMVEVQLSMNEVC